MWELECRRKDGSFINKPWAFQQKLKFQSHKDKKKRNKVLLGTVWPEEELITDWGNGGVGSASLWKGITQFFLE